MCLLSDLTTVSKMIKIKSMHAGSFRVSVIHRTLTRTTGYFTCVRDYSYACVNTHKHINIRWVRNGRGGAASGARVGAGIKPLVLGWYKICRNSFAPFTSCADRSRNNVTPSKRRKLNKCQVNSRTCYEDDERPIYYRHVTKQTWEHKTCQ